MKPAQTRTTSSTIQVETNDSELNATVFRDERLTTGRRLWLRVGALAQHERAWREDLLGCGHGQTTCSYVKIHRRAVRRCVTLIAVSFLALQCTSAATLAQQGPWAWKQDGTRSLALLRGDQVVWHFHAEPDAPKPYFDPVALPGGPSLTWNRPPDHPWHHGLWFSWKFINGVNYWEPAAGSPFPAGRTRWHDVTFDPRPDHSAQITMKLEYSPGNGDGVLREDRTILVSAPADDGSYALDWTSCFTAGDAEVVLDRTPLPNEPGGKAWGGYAGLSVRLAGELSDRAADSTEGPVPFNQQNRFRGRAAALDYHGTIDGRPVGVAVIDHPKNLRHPTPWYVIRSGPMSYFSPAVLCFEPYKMAPREQLVLQYRIVIHHGRWDQDRLRKEFARFARQ